MMKRLIQDANSIFLACGTTDFRKQIPGLVAMVQMQFKLDPEVSMAENTKRCKGTLVSTGRMAVARGGNRTEKSTSRSKNKPQKQLFLIRINDGKKGKKAQNSAFLGLENVPKQ